MKKSGLLDWLQEEQRQWDGLLEEIGLEGIDQPGVAAHWSIKDIIAHLTGWQRHLVARIEAARRGEPEPPPPWPAHLEEDDDINAWIYELNHGRSVSEVLDDMAQLYQRLIAVIEALPEDVRIEHVEPAFYLVWLDDKRFLASEFFNHFHDDHEPDVRAWLAQIEKQDEG